MPEDETQKYVKSLDAILAMQRQIEQQLAAARAAEAATAAAAARQAQDNKR